jgi:phosphoribosylformylglycinamidine synthase
MGALPIANTDVLCFAPSNYSKETLSKLPKKLKHPLSILQGVHKGIEDGGNKSGIPTVNGAIHFHDNYAGKPLVYCGTIGVMPQKILDKESSEKFYQAGDLIVVCGGSVGADGIHGATFSSLEMDDNAPSTAVQIGDPFTQKRLTDFLIEARDQLLFSGLTDNGAGGLSSSVGEMAEKTNGALINLETIPLKYQGLSPFEIIISESQERMTFAVPIEKINAFMALAKKRQVNPAIIGEFHSRGNFEIKQNGKLISSLSLEFLHESLKPMELEAHFEGIKEDKPWHCTKTTAKRHNLNQCIKDILVNDNIRSKESLVRQFDHEVKASTVVKPFITNKNSSPSDAAVIWTHLYGGSKDGAIAISNGLCPQLSHIDTYYMTQMAIDEAVRNAVATGANPSYISLCDNFCWPDPIESNKNPDAKHKLAQLVRSSQALYDTAMVYGTPFISGKDSMKNDFIGETPNGEFLKISVPPTLLISALAKMDSVEDFMTSDFKDPEDIIYQVGASHFEKQYFSTFNQDLLTHAPISLDTNKVVFHKIHELIKSGLIKSCHDVSEGGIITALIESSFAQGLGVKLQNDLINKNESLESLLFNEISGNFIISVNISNEAKLKAVLNLVPHRRLGVTTKEPVIKYTDKIDLNTNELFSIWSENDY